MTPVRATIIALVSNIVLKVVFVWGFHLGVAGVALGAALGAWINVGLLTWLGCSRALLAIEKAFVRSLPPVLIAAIAAGGGGFDRGASDRATGARAFHRYCRPGRRGRFWAWRPMPAVILFVPPGVTHCVKYGE